MIKTMTF